MPSPLLSCRLSSMAPTPDTVILTCLSWWLSVPTLGGRDSVQLLCLRAWHTVRALEMFSEQMNEVPRMRSRCSPGPQRPPVVTSGLPFPTPPSPSPQALSRASPWHRPGLPPPGVLLPSGPSPGESPEALQLSPPDSLGRCPHIPSPVGVSPSISDLASPHLEGPPGPGWVLAVSGSRALHSRCFTYEVSQQAVWCPGQVGRRAEGPLSPPEPPRGSPQGGSSWGHGVPGPERPFQMDSPPPSL